jgi:hypothetical protein
MKIKKILLTVFTVVAVTFSVGGKNSINVSAVAESKSLTTTHNHNDKCETTHLGTTIAVSKSLTSSHKNEKINVVVKKNKANDTLYRYRCIYCDKIVWAASSPKQRAGGHYHYWLRGF